MAPCSGRTITVGGAALNPAVAGTGRLSLGTNAGKLLSVSSSTGAWSSVPGNTLGAVRAMSACSRSAPASRSWRRSERLGVLGEPGHRRANWVVKLNADAVQSAVSTYLRPFFSSAMTTAYPGTYDIVFVATMNNTASGGFTNNKVFALRSDTGATLWTFSPATLASGPCPAGCPMDQVLGQPWVDYVRDRLLRGQPGRQRGDNQNEICVPRHRGQRGAARGEVCGR